MLAIEASAYAFPVDAAATSSTRSPPATWPRCCVDERGALLGYFVAMTGVDEMHLLNLTVAPPGRAGATRRACSTRWSRLPRAAGAHGCGSRCAPATRVRAALYARHGFAEVGVRSGYYPARARTREDAIVMSLTLTRGRLMRWTERQRALLRGMGMRAAGCAAIAAHCARGRVDADEVAAAARPAGAAGRPRRSDVRPVAAPRQPGAARAPAARRHRRARLARRCAPRSRPAAPARCARRAARRCSASATRSAHWMIVGEAPGEQEDLQGEPFVGQAGQLLDNMLRALGLTRAATADAAQRQVYIANTLKCRPPRQPQPGAGRTGAVRALPAAPGRAGAAAHHPGDGPLRGAGAAAQRASRSAGCAAACTATRACRWS